MRKEDACVHRMCTAGVCVCVAGVCARGCLCMEYVYAWGVCMHSRCVHMGRVCARRVCTHRVSVHTAGVCVHRACMWGRGVCAWQVCVCARSVCAQRRARAHRGACVEDAGTDRTYSRRRPWLSSWEGGTRQQLNLITSLPRRFSPARADAGVSPSRTHRRLEGHPQASLLSGRPGLGGPGGWQAAEAAPAERASTMRRSVPISQVRVPRHAGSNLSTVQTGTARRDQVISASHTRD